MSPAMPGEPPLMHKRFTSLMLLALCLTVEAVGADYSANINKNANINNKGVDFSGHWELDYQRSEDIRQEIELLYNQAKADYERALDRTRENFRNRGGKVHLEPGMSNYRSIIGLGRLTEKITQATLLDIAQTADHIVIKRNEDYSLVCDFNAPQPRQTPTGEEVCAWLDHQLAFQTNLAEGLVVNHLLSLAPNRQRLSIATTVNIRGLRWPFTIKRVFMPYKPSKGRYHCEFTLAKQKTCTLLGKEVE